MTNNKKIIVGGIKSLMDTKSILTGYDILLCIAPEFISPLKKLMMKYPRTRKLLTPYSIFGVAGPSKKQIVCRKQRPMKKLSKK